MSLSDFRSSITCQDCSKIYEDPILLPCNTSICKKDLTKYFIEPTKDNLIMCPFCHNQHEKPKQGFPENTKLNYILQHLSTTVSSLNSTHDHTNQLSSPRQNQNEFIEENFIKIFNRINLLRNETKAQVDLVFDDFIKQANKLVNECKLKSSELFDEDANPQNQLNEPELKQMIRSVKNSLLLNHSVVFEPMKLEKEQLGNRKVGPMPSSQSTPTSPTRLYASPMAASNYLEEVRKKSIIVTDSEFDSQRVEDKTLKPRTQPTTRSVYIALQDYVPKTKEELSFCKGELIYVNENEKSENLWFGTVYKKADVMKDVSGLVHSKHLGEYNEIENEPWYFGKLNREQAETLLKNPINKEGSFLVRLSCSDSNNHCYSLSVKDSNKCFKHYKINRNLDEANCSSYFISPNEKFKTLSELISSYLKRPECFCCQLTTICKK